MICPTFIFPFTTSNEVHDQEPCDTIPESRDLNIQKIVLNIVYYNVPCRFNSETGPAWLRKYTFEKYLNVLSFNSLVLAYSVFSTLLEDNVRVICSLRSWKQWYEKIIASRNAWAVCSNLVICVHCYSNKPGLGIGIDPGSSVTSIRLILGETTTFGREWSFLPTSPDLIPQLH